jgi:ferric-dicitrate binding protein FerR (iron transport regulator)
LFYGESEVGEVAILKVSDGSHTILNANSCATVLAAET